MQTAIDISELKRTSSNQVSIRYQVADWTREKRSLQKEVISVKSCANQSTRRRRRRSRLEMWKLKILAFTPHTRGNHRTDELEKHSNDNKYARAYSVLNEESVSLVLVTTWK